MIVKYTQFLIFIVRLIYITSLKPIFHCDAKLLALGTSASPNAKDSTYALESVALGEANFLCRSCFHFLGVDFICVG